MLGSEKAARDVSLQMTDAFRDCFHQLENTRDNLFLTGRAGTGKSTFLDYFRSLTAKKVAVVAPTGVAAVNVHGQTIHSLFRFKPHFIPPDRAPSKVRYKRELYKNLDLLIIDEISMVRADLFDAVEAFLRVNGKRPGRPFGGCQICAVGDLYQLPPVVNGEDRQIYFNYYDSPYFFAANAFSAAEFQMVQFDRIFRQQDRDFVAFLNRVRENEATADDLDWLNAQCGGPDPSRPYTNDPITLTATNAVADRLNGSRLAALPGPERIYEGEATGNFGTGAGRLPAPSPLTLKEGAQVMFVKNDKDKRWVNGSIGRVKHLAHGEITVRITDDSGTREESVTPETWEAIKYDFDAAADKIVEKVDGSYTQFPLQPAWAITIHKSQGKTFDDVVIDLGRGAFAAGQTYVALSRCRSAGGIRLARPLRPADIRIDPQIRAFMNEIPLVTADK